MRKKLIWNADGNSSQRLLSVLDAYGEWVEQLIEEGWYAYYTSVMFNKIAGTAGARKDVMRQELERVYSMFVTRVVRKPTSPGQILYLPRFIGCEDRMVPKKNSKAPLSDLVVNDGVHLNGILLIPFKSRLKKHPLDYFADNQKHYCRCGGPLQRIHITTISETPKRNSDYTFKAIKRGYVPEDEIIILPKAIDEMVRSNKGGKSPN